MNNSSKYIYLGKINSPSELKALPDEAMPVLAKEIREDLISRVTKNGGHLASNLGVVELSMAIHRVFDSPRDHIIFDVGHQSYVHKMLTGRFDRMDTLRKPGGISGFTKRDESEYDAFGTGHSSTSLSAGLGFAESDKLNGNDAYTIVVLGDGAYTGGMIHEALNNCSKDLNLIIILNENEISISKNIGRFAVITNNDFSKKGDVDGDGIITSYDARFALCLAANLVPEVSDAQVKTADVDGKNGVSTEDARNILRYAAGIIDSFN